MTQAMIHPGTREASPTAAGALVRGLLPAVCAALAMAGGESTVAAAQAVTLELDYLADTNAIVSRTKPDYTLERSFANLSLSVTIKTQLESFKPMDPNCLYPDETDSVLCGTLGGDDAWYAHGLVVPNYAVYQKDTYGKWICPGGWKGLLWVMPPCATASGAAKITTSGARKHFLEFWNSRVGNTPEEMDNDAFATNVHELGHVLNLHHCEYRKDNLDSYGIFPASGKSASHVGEPDLKHVMPGWPPDPGYPWCDSSGTEHNHRKRLHFGCRDSCSPLSESEEGPFPPELVAKLHDLNERVELDVTPQKTWYLPGEPIDVDVSVRRLSADSQSTHLYLVESLDPQLGRLIFSVASSEESNAYRALRPPLLVDATRTELIPLESRAVRNVAGIWFTLYDDPGIVLGRPFWLKADFAGFDDVELYLTTRAPKKVEVGQNQRHPELYDKEAYLLFTDPLSRRFLFLLGGDHLKAGFEKLQDVSRRFGGTLYAAYADVALGAYWARPFRGIDAHGATITREADYEKAIRHLEKARQWNVEHQDPEAKLSPFYTKIMETTLALVTSARGSHRP